MLCQLGPNEIDMFVLPEDEEYVKETDTRNEPLQDSQPMQISKRSKSHMHEAPDEQTENPPSQRLQWEDRTAQGLAANAEYNAHIQRLRREDQTAQCVAAAIKKSSEVPHAAPAPAPAPGPATAPLLGSRVRRSQGNASAEALRASTADPFTYAEAMDSPQQNHCKSVMEEESTSIMLNNTFSALNFREARQLQA